MTMLSRVEDPWCSYPPERLLSYGNVEQRCGSRLSAILAGSIGIVIRNGDPLPQGATPHRARGEAVA